MEISRKYVKGNNVKYYAFYHVLKQVADNIHRSLAI